jgi:hypothetical protein
MRILAGKDAKADLVIALGAIATTFVVLSPVLLRRGWPYNHEWLNFIERVTALAAQWRLGHLIPVWSTAELLGYGSPSVGIYHKAYSYLAALFFLVTGGIKKSLVLALGVFSVVAFTGVARCVRAVKGSPAITVELFAGFCLLSSNYATLDWLVRGAFSEYSALCVSPWLFLWSVGIMKDGRWALWIGPALAAVFLCHTTIAFFGSALLAIAVVIAVLRGVAIRPLIRPAAVSIVIFALCIAPFVLPVAALFDYGRSDAFLVPGFTPQTHRVDLIRFFFDRAWTWGRTWEGYTVQIDPGLLLGLIPFAAMLGAYGVRRWRGGLRAARCGCGEQDVILPFGLFLVCVLGGCLFLQTKEAFFVYETIPGAIYIQFAWRLLTFITVAAVLASALVFLVLLGPDRTSGESSELRRIIGGGFMIGIALSTLNNDVLITGTQYDWFPPQMLRETAAHPLDLFAGGEYMPRTPDASPRQLLDRLAKSGTPEDQGNCTVQSLTGTGERRESSFRVKCATPGVVKLPLFYSGAETIWVGSENRTEMKSDVAPRTCEDPRLQLSLAAGDVPVVVEAPTWWSVVGRRLLATPAFAYARDCPSK